MNLKSSKIAAATIAALLCTTTLTACKKTDESTTSSDSETTSSISDNAETAEENNEEPAIMAIFGEIRTEYNDNLDLTKYPLTENNVPEDFELVIEAEEAELSGNCKAVEADGFSGSGFVTGLNGQNDKIEFKVMLENSGMYDLNFRCNTPDGGRVNYVFIDGKHSGDIKTAGSQEISDSYMKGIYLEAGEHTISLSPQWGYVDYDSLIITANTSINDDTYNITEPLSNPNADENTKRLYKFLCDIYGNYTLTGQFADKARMSTELTRIEQATGKEFAVLGMDMMNYSSQNVKNGASSSTVEFAYDWYENAGGIVQLCWHWNSPEHYAKNDSNNPWYKSFYKEASNIDLDKIMNGEDDEGYELLMKDIDLIAEQLERLRDMEVPIIWRPLHEASGGWFWWGNCEPESYKKLWNTMYDKMTNEHNLTNLIWMWNGQDPEWYPGDETIDIISYDIYAGNHVYESFGGTFTECVETSPNGKLVALSENGCVMDPELTMKNNTRWLFWGTWADPFTLKNFLLNEEYTEKDMLIKAYNSDRTLTLDELPNLKTYPLD
ncbi:MAG: glycosyl hydrolase [Oscillospiraceae bacterium]